jgi:FkbM family methyltransferase
MNNKYCIFKYDNDCKIILPEYDIKYKELNYSDIFSNRNEHEVIFRKINTILINNKIINGNIIDLGSWIGDNSIPWAKNISGIVYAIDPSQDNCNFIKKISEINEIENIVILKEVISDSINMVSTNDNLWHASFQLNENGLNKTKSTSLDQLYKDNVIKNIDYIHLDVEGMEKRVILGAENLINEYQPIITFEQHISWEDYIGLSNYLKNKNYKVYLINEILPGCMPDCRNFLATPERLNDINIYQIINENIGISNILTIL